MHIKDELDGFNLVAIVVLLALVLFASGCGDSLANSSGYERTNPMEVDPTAPMVLVYENFSDDVKILQDKVSKCYYLSAGNTRSAYIMMRNADDTPYCPNN